MWFIGLTSQPKHENMNIIKTDIPDVLIIEPKIFGDPRGFFLEHFKVDRYSAVGAGGPFVQDNLSWSSRGVLRGLHLQKPNPQAKLLMLIRGRVLDVAVSFLVAT